MANEINNSNNKDVKLQKLSEQELKQELNNDHSSSYSQSEKAYLIAKCSGNILVEDINGFRFVSKEDIHYFDINKYKIIEPPFETYIREKNNSSENKILKTNNTKESSTSYKEEDLTENKTEITDDKNLRNMSLSLMENISYFLFQSKEELEFFNNNKSSSSGLCGYGLDLI
ncbi:MAG: hypothetical protein MSA89_13925 [Clostridium sp.]|nr:hypothetical protein [Clostridium sp.]MCI7444155.1 hypothetical protein [Clostridium sp.]